MIIHLLAHAGAGLVNPYNYWIRLRNSIFEYSIKTDSFPKMPGKNLFLIYLTVWVTK